MLKDIIKYSNRHVTVLTSYATKYITSVLCHSIALDALSSNCRLRII